MKTIKSNRFTAGSILLLLTSLILLTGILTFLKPCGPANDGSWMNCHWAGQSVTGIAAVLVILSIMHLIFTDPRIRTGLAAAMIPTALLAALIPGRLIHLCMMNSMRCHAVMTPGVWIISLLITAAAVVDILQNRKASV